MWNHCITPLEEYDVVFDQEFEKDQVHQFINKYFTDISIDELHQTTTMPFAKKPYHNMIMANFVSLDIKNSAGIVIGKIAYSFVDRGGLGNSRVLLFDNCVHNLIDYSIIQYPQQKHPK